jgi:predicted CxxxxCH...CXXCH cytochrome family protein
MHTGKRDMLTSRFLVIAVLPFFLACASKLDPDYEIPSGDIHPFAEVGDHGAYLTSEDYDFSQCTSCHGDDLAGQSSGPGGATVRSCLRCHRADNHLVGFEGADEHAQYLRGKNWDLHQCFICHYPYGTPEGVHFGGSCSSSNCHSDGAMGPGSCNTCHGTFSGNPADTLAWAPPEDLSGNTDRSFPGVGAHQAHLEGSTGFAAPVPCSACHRLPSAWDSPGHIDDGPNRAGIVWGFPADARGAAPDYDLAASTCSSTHCHGSAEPVWTDVGGAWAGCGMCHGLPPGVPHPDATMSQCANCHGEVIDASGSIIAPAMHINGIVDLSFGG